MKLTALVGFCPSAVPAIWRINIVVVEQNVIWYSVAISMQRIARGEVFKQLKGQRLGKEVEVGYC